jgi:hypothetical protein
VTLDGNPISPVYTTFTASGKQFAVAIVDMTPGVHRITTGSDESKGAILVGYAYGPADSYGYSAGSLLKPISGIIAKKTSIGNIATAQQIVSLHNMLDSRIYLDSVALLVNGKSATSVSFKERVWQDIDHVDVNGTQVLHIDASKLTVPTMCTMKIYHHVYTHDFCRDAYFTPTEIKFMAYPATTATVVDHNAGNAEITVYPNPLTRRVHVECQQAFTGYIVRNALGAEVRSGMSGEASTLDLDLHALPAGTYWIDLMNQGRLVGRVPVHKTNQ